MTIRADLLDRVAEVYKAVNPAAGQHTYETEPAFTWPCRARPVSPTAQAQVTGRFVHGDYRLFGNAPTEGTIVKGDRLLLDNGLDLRVTSEAERPHSQLGYLTLTASRS